jgi:hypothetical protein
MAVACAHLKPETPIELPSRVDIKDGKDDMVDASVS